MRGGQVHKAITCGVLVLLVASCGQAPTPTAATRASGAPTMTDPAGTMSVAAPTPVIASATPAVSPAGTLVLHTFPDDLSCDAITVAYRSVTFRIELGAAQPVTAVTDAGEALPVLWAAAFSPGADAVLAPDGSVLLRDGDRLAIPSHGWPTLGGFIVCPSPRALYVLASAP